MASQKPYTYQDLDLRMLITTNGDIALLNDAAAIRQSIKNIANLMQMDIPFDSKHYAGIQKLLFEQPGALVESEISMHIKVAIQGLEPRVTVSKVVTQLQSDLVSYMIQVYYTINVSKVQDTTTIIISRVR